MLHHEVPGFVYAVFAWFCPIGSRIKPSLFWDDLVCRRFQKWEIGKRVGHIWKHIIAGWWLYFIQFRRIKVTINKNWLPFPDGSKPEIR